jgi:nuclear RNA export factor
MIFPDLVDNYAVALFRPVMMSAVLDIVVENVPELAALDLSDNKLYVLNSLSVLAVKAPNLKILHIGRNRVSKCIQSDYCCMIFQFVNIHVCALCRSVVS